MKYIFILPTILTVLFATIINVPDDYATIQEGINVSSDGDTVLVQPGTYVENINFNGHNITLGSLFIITHDTSYISQTVIDGSQIDNVVIFENGENSTIFSGFSIINGGGNSSIWCNNSSPHIKSISVIQNNCPAIAMNYSNPVLEELTIEGNHEGILVYAYSSPTINKCLIFSNLGHGIHCGSESNANIINTTITNNDVGLECSWGSSPSIINTIIWGNTQDFQWSGENSPQISFSLLEEFPSQGADLGDNVYSNPQFVDSDGSNFHLQSISPCIDAGNPDLNGNGITWIEDIEDQDPDGSRRDIGALYNHQNIVNVSGDVSGAWYPDALYQVVGPINVPSNDTLIINPGTVIEFLGYYGFNINGSLFAEGTEQDSIHFRSGLEPHTNLDWGGIFFSTSEASCVISYAEISHGASGGGDYDGLLYFGYTYERDITIEHCTVRHSGAHGFFINEHSHPNILNNNIKDNNRCGIKLRQQSSPSIVGNQIQYNSECGIKSKWNCNALISNNIISNNPWGIYNRDQCTTTIQYNLFKDNGASIILEDSSPIILNNTIVNNNAFGIAVWNGSYPVIENNIICSNQVGISADGTPVSISYNNFYNNSTSNFNGPGLPSNIGLITVENNNSDPCDEYFNIYLNPNFANEEIYTLMSDSPSIDGGNPEADPDPDGSISDIGAQYYHQISGCTDQLAINFDPNATIDDSSCIYLEDLEPHFATVWQGIPNNPMGFYIASATIDGIDLRVGDEIAIFDGDICVGHAQLESEIVPNLQIFASLDNPSTEEQDGFIIGNEIYYRYWDASDQIEVINVIAEVTAGQEVFQSLGFSNAILSVGLIPGCTDQEADNYNPEATYDDGACLYLVHGCMDDTACNYNPEATLDDGSCLYNDCNGECDGPANFDECGICDDDPLNDNECIGCTDPWAINYEQDNTIDDGSCFYPGFGDLIPDGSLNVLDIVALVEHVLEEFQYVSFIDLNSDGYINIIDIVILVDIILNPEYLGCMDPLASNYNPDAIYDEGNCDLCVDIDGNTYATIQIGDQLWMSENLKTTHYNNGDYIVDWIHAVSSFWDPNGYCDGDCIELFGYFYEYYAVEDDRGICPDGWHVPGDIEWIELEMFMGLSEDEAYNSGPRGDGLGSRLAGINEVWDPGALSEHPDFGFSGLNLIPAGYRFWNGNCDLVGSAAYYWSSTNRWKRKIPSTSTSVIRNVDSAWAGFSIRCIEDDENTYGCKDSEADNYNPEAIIDDGSCEYSCMDIDGNIYDAVRIGDQVWMAENLKTTHYNNGDEIPTNYTGSQWSALSIGAFAVYNDDPSIAGIYGNLYNWFAADDSRGVCPEDWYVPTDDEWMELEMFLGMSYEDAHDTGYRGSDEGSQLAGIAELWNNGDLENNPAFGSSGFTALASGERYYLWGYYTDIGNYSLFWSSTEQSSDNAWYRNLYNNNPMIGHDYMSHDKRGGFSLRCVKN